MLDCDDSIALVHVQDQPSKASFLLSPSLIYRRRSSTTGASRKKYVNRHQPISRSHSTFRQGVHTFHTFVCYAHLSLFLLFFRSGDNQERKRETEDHYSFFVQHIFSESIDLDKEDNRTDRTSCFIFWEGEERKSEREDDDSTSSR